MIYLLLEEQVLGKVLQCVCTWIKEINIYPVPLMWDSTQQKNLDFFQHHLGQLHKISQLAWAALSYAITNDVTVKFGKGQSMKGKFQNFSLLPCSLHPCGKAAPTSLPKGPPWDSRASKEEEACPQQCCWGQQEQSLPRASPLLTLYHWEAQTNAELCILLCGARHFSLNISVPKGAERKNREE